MAVSTRVKGLVKPAPQEPPAYPKVQKHETTESVVRFDIHQRIQHILMFTSFIALAATGLPQKFHGWSVSQAWIATLGGLESAQHIHHIAAYVMIFDCLYHFAYLVRSVLIKRQFAALRMIPMPKDVMDAFKMFTYFLGMSDERPRFGRFSYLEKFDYWAVFWGIFIIGGSGVILLFPVQISQVVPGGLVPVALAAHSDEAVLAVGWIFIVHLFYVHLAPAVFPFNTSIFSGRMSKERYAEEHPLEYERLFRTPDGNHHEVPAGGDEAVLVATEAVTVAEAEPAPAVGGVDTPVSQPNVSAEQVGLPEDVVAPIDSETATHGDGSEA